MEKIKTWYEQIIARHKKYPVLDKEAVKLR